MSYPLVRDLAAEGISVRLNCGVLGHSTQAFYAWLRQPVSRRDLEDAHLTNALIDAHGDDPELGYRLLCDELERLGETIGERRVWRLRSQPEALLGDGAQGPARQRKDARAGGARRPRAARVHRGTAEPGVGHRHH